MKLELFPLKYEVNHRGKSYIIEANDYYYNNNDETKWLVTCEGNVLTKYYELTNSMLVQSFEFAFDTKDEAVAALTIYLTIEDKKSKEINKYKEEILSLRHCLSLQPISDPNKYVHKESHFMSLFKLKELLKDKGLTFISLSNSNYLGVQVSCSTIKNMLLLEQAIKEIEFETDFMAINYLADDYLIRNYSWPLYYYRDCGDLYVRQFAFIKKSEYID